MTDPNGFDPRLVRSGETTKARQNLAGEGALFAREWDISDMPWLNSDDGLVALAEPPPPPSRREPRGSASSLVPPALGGAAASAERRDRAASRSVITVPKKKRPEEDVVSARVLLRPPPPTVERDAWVPSLGERLEVPSVERDAGPSGNWLESLRTKHRPLAAVSTVLLAAVTYAVTSGLVQSSTATSEPPPVSLPEFLQHSAETAAAASASASASSPPPTPDGASALLSPSSALPSAAVAAPDSPASSETASAAEPGSRAEPPPVPSAATAVAATAAELPNPAVAAKAAAAPIPKASPSADAPPAATTRAAPPAASSAPPARAVGSPERSASKPSILTPSEARSPSSARAEAARSPLPMTSYTYAEMTLFRVATAPKRVTDLVLQPGETLAVPPTTGDAARWVIHVADSVAGGQPQSHVFVQPLRPGLTTNLTLTTTRRSYRLELSSSDDGTYMAAVEWRYPLDAAERRRQELARAEAERKSSTAVSDLQALRFDYRIEVRSGSPSWKPISVFDDGQKTFIRFPRPIAAAASPLLFVLRSGGVKNASFVNYRIKQDLFVIERLIDVAELRLPRTGEDGTTAQDVIRITRRGEAR